MSNKIMSKETEAKTPTDNIKESDSSDQTSEIANQTTEQKKAEATPSPTDSSASDIEALKSITQDLLKVAKAQTDTIASQKQEIAELKEKLTTLDTDYQNSKPLDRRAEVVGLFDWGKQKEIFANDHYKSQKDYAYKLLNDLDLEFPPA